MRKLFDIAMVSSTGFLFHCSGVSKEIRTKSTYDRTDVSREVSKESGIGSHPLIIWMKRKIQFKRMLIITVIGSS